MFKWKNRSRPLPDPILNMLQLQAQQKLKSLFVIQRSYMSFVGRRVTLYRGVTSTPIHQNVDFLIGQRRYFKPVFQRKKNRNGEITFGGIATISKTAKDPSSHSYFSKFCSRCDECPGDQKKTHKTFQKMYVFWVQSMLTLIRIKQFGTQELSSQCWRILQKQNLYHTHREARMLWNGYTLS